VAILGVGTIEKRPAVVTLPDGTDTIAPRLKGMLTMSFDHRELGYALEHLCGPSKNGPAQASGILPPQVMALTEFGFNPDLFQSEADSSGWTP